MDNIKFVFFKIPMLVFVAECITLCYSPHRKAQYSS